MAMHLDTVTE